MKDEATLKNCDIMTLACVFGHISTVEKLIDEKFEAKIMGSKKRTPLICSTWDGPDEIAQTLLDSGTLTDHQNDKRATALSYATIVNRFEVVRMLLRASTDPNIKPIRI